MGKTRWGILAPGNIAHKLAKGLLTVSDAQLTAVASRNIDRAREFAREYGAPTSYGSYQELVADPDVDAIYVASPHSLHREHSILCLEAGKAVLCEKPFAINEKQAREMVDCARANGVPLLEAMWSRFLPVTLKVRQWIADGAIGEPRMVLADFGFRTGFNPQGRLFDPNLGGGGLLDVGVYAVSYASMVLGKPDQVTGFAEIGETGVDEQAVMALRYPGNKLASLACGVRTQTPHQAWILGTDGKILVPDYWHATTATLIQAGKPDETVNLAFQGNGYEYQVMEVGNLLREGRTESEILPLDESLSIMGTLDELRRQWGVKYPME
ncbi:Gfo/Idh/MocA family oxidoreductase [bacterium]|nr:Gfo/Idh/MocA family oxidoreductase [bacterium]